MITNGFGTGSRASMVVDGAQRMMLGRLGERSCKALTCPAGLALVVRGGSHVAPTELTED